MKQRALRAAVFLLALGPAAWSGEALEATVFYSKEDPRWPAAEKILDEAVAPFAKRAVLEKVSIDDAAGYARLARVEKELPVEQPGEITLVAARFALTSSGTRRDVETHAAAALARLLEPGGLKEPGQADVARYASERFGPQAAIPKEPKQPGALRKEFEDALVRAYRVQHAETAAFLGWVLEVQREIRCPVCKSVHFLLAVSPERKIEHLLPVKELELFGRPLNETLSTRFLGQFKGRLAGELVKVDAISGATKTCLTYETCVNHALDVIMRQVQKDAKEKQGAQP